MKSGLRVVFLLLLLSGIAAGDIDWGRLVPFRGSKTTTTARTTTTTTTRAPAVRVPKPAAGGGFNLADAIGSTETPAAGACPQKEMIQKLGRMIVKQNELMQNLMNVLNREGKCVS